MTFMEVLSFAGLGAVLGLDVVSFPQAMLSRPLIAATLAGALAGDAERGLVIGAILEMMALGTLPFGAARYPEWGSASVVGGALYAHAHGTDPGQLTFAVLAALLAAWLSGESMVAVRKLNGIWARRARAALDAGDARAVGALQRAGLVLDFVRGGVVTAVALALLVAAFVRVVPLWSGSAATERTVLIGATAGLGSATVWMLVRGAPGAHRLLAAGMVAGLIAVLA